MSNVRSFTDKEILDRVRGLPTFRGFPIGVMDVWIRSTEDAFNKFDDKVYTFACFGEEKEPEFVMVCTGTTNAGSQGLKNFQTYNREGCAVLKSDVIVYESHAWGYHRGKYPAYRQVRPFPYYRDNDRDDRAEEIGEVHMDIIGANCHKAGVFTENINGNSVACLVRNQLAQFNKWMEFMHKRPLTVAILKEW